MQVVARIEEDQSMIRHIIMVDGDDEDLELMLASAVRHAHDMRQRTILADEDRVVVEQMLPDTNAG